MSDFHRGDVRVWMAEVYAYGTGKVSALLERQTPIDVAMGAIESLIQRNWLRFTEQSQRAFLRGEVDEADRVLEPAFETHEGYYKTSFFFAKEAVDFLEKSWPSCHSCKHAQGARVSAIFDCAGRHRESALVCTNCRYSASVETWVALAEGRGRALAATDRGRVRAHMQSLAIESIGKGGMRAGLYEF